MAEVVAMRNNALPYPVYGVPWTVVYPFLDADGDLVTGATTPDAEVSKNGDTFADCTNESTEIATSSGMYYLTLTGTEMTADIVAVIAKSATAGMKTTALTFYPRKLVTIRSGTSASGGASTSTIVLDGSASAVDDFYNGMLCVATIDTLVEARIITDYTGSNQTATVTPDWNVAPDNNDTFVIYLPEGVQINQANATAFGGTAGTFASGRPEVNTTHIAGSAVSTSTAQLGVNVVNFGGAAGTFASGRPEVNSTHIAGSSISADGPVPWLGIVDQGTAQSATGTTVVLRAAAAFANSTLVGATIAVLGSTQGYWQFREITANTLVDDTVTVDTWTVTPSGTITYKIFGGPPALVALPNVNVETIKTNPVVNGGTITFPTNATLASTTNITAGTITTATNVTTVNGLAANVITAAAIAADAIGASELAADAVAEIADQVWDELIVGHLGAGSTGAALNAAGSAGDPWSTPLPGAYGAGTAGHIIGTALPDIAAGSAGGLLIAGSNAATTFATLTVSGATTLTGNVSMAAGLTITQSTGNASAVSITGNGTGHGLSVTSGSGATGNGIHAISAATNGNGFNGLGTGTGNGMLLTGGVSADGDALHLVSSGAGVGIRSQGNFDITGEFTTSGTTRFNALTVTNALTISGTTTLTGAIAATNASNDIRGTSLSAAGLANVNAEVVDCLNTDTYAQPGQGTPAATTTIVSQLGYLYKAFRNKSTQDATTYKLYNDDAATVDQKATCSDDTTTFTKGEIATGP